MNTKYISSSVLKTLEFSRVRSTSEYSDIFNSRDEIYLVFTKKSIFFFLSYAFDRQHAMSHPLKMEVLTMQKQICLANLNNFGTKIFVTF